MGQFFQQFKKSSKVWRAETRHRVPSRRRIQQALASSGGLQVHQRLAVEALAKPSQMIGCSSPTFANSSWPFSIVISKGCLVIVLREHTARSEGSGGGDTRLGSCAARGLSSHARTCPPMLCVALYLLPVPDCVKMIDSSISWDAVTGASMSADVRQQEARTLVIVAVKEGAPIAYVGTVR